jgi:hypothetical protein
MKDGSKVGLLIIDEAQDLRSSKMKIIVNLAKKHTDLDVYIAGDYLQTLYSDDRSDVTSMGAHAMNVFKLLNPTYFDLNICKRCPKGHVDFNNLLLQNIQKKYIIPPMESDNYNTEDKPVLFTHLKTSDNNTNARINAEQVTKMIETLMEKYNTIKPGDIAIIMAKTKGNEVFFQLQNTLTALYKTKGFTNMVCHMNTDADGYHNRLDFDATKGKTIMLSIHGDKGRGHKVVFFLGLTEGSIPRDIYIYKPSEIIPESLLNVATTRSTKYLFIGFTQTYPSRYLWRHRDELKDYAYLAWNNSDDVPEPYKSVINSQRSEKPVWNSDYKKEKTNTGSKSELQVKGDISKDFEQAKDFIMYPWRREEKIHIFGNKQKISGNFQEDHYVLLGMMAELLIRRVIVKKNLLNFLIEYSKEEKLIYTDDERFLSCMYDIRDIKSAEEFDGYLKRYRSFLFKNPDLQIKIKEAFYGKKTVIHSIFMTLSFKKDLEEFICFSKNNNQLRPDCIWNVSLFYNQINQKIYRPAVNSFIDFFNQDISVLHENIDNYINLKLRGNDLNFEKYLKISGLFSFEELLAINKEYHSIRISGRCDIYDSTNNSLIEVKASGLDVCSQEWITQSLGYYLLLDIYNYPVDNMHIVNILRGCLWEWKMPEMPLLEEVITKKISKKYEWHDIETKSLVRSVQNYRQQKMNQPSSPKPEICNP